MPKPPDFDKAFAASRTVAWTLGGCLLLYLLIEESGPASGRSSDSSS